MTIVRSDSDFLGGISMPITTAHSAPRRSAVR
jgi:hypothetical protein